MDYSQGPSRQSIIHILPPEMGFLHVLLVEQTLTIGGEKYP